MCWTFSKMSGKRRTLWRGSLELSEDEELDIAVATHQPSLRGQETFDWKIKNDEVCLIFKEIWNWQGISGQFSSVASELPFQTKRLEDLPPRKLAGWGAIMSCLLSPFHSISCTNPGSLFQGDWILWPFETVALEKVLCSVDQWGKSNLQYF